MTTTSNKKVKSIEETVQFLKDEIEKLKAVPVLWMHMDSNNQKINSLEEAVEFLSDEIRNQKQQAWETRKKNL